MAFPTFPTITNLVTHWQNITAADRQKQLTTLGNKSQTTVDTSRLTQAAQSAAMDFEVELGVKYDDEKLGHVHLAAEGVTAHLYKAAGMSSTLKNETLEYWVGKLQKVKSENYQRIRVSSKTQDAAARTREDRMPEEYWNPIRPTRDISGGSGRSDDNGNS